MEAVRRFAPDARAAHGLAQQIYARQIFGHLRLLHRCALTKAMELAHVSTIRRADNPVRAGVSCSHVAVQSDAGRSVAPGKAGAPGYARAGGTIARGY